MTVGSLFAGIGGFDLGLERAGFTVKWQVEIDPYALAVLAKHWPHVARYGDICTVRGADVEPVDVLCGGFPCQDISLAGKGAGITGKRSGLWSEFDRLIGELRPRYVIVENVSALLVRGIERVLGDLAARGYDAEWDCLPASAFGAPHQRDRVWLVAYPNANGRRQQERAEFNSHKVDNPADWYSRGKYVDRLRDDVADAERAERWPQAEGRNDAHGHDARREEAPGRTRECGQDVADADHSGPQRRHGEVVSERASEWAARPSGSPRTATDADSNDEYRRRGDVQVGRVWRSRTSSPDVYRDGTQWRVEPNVGRVAHGIPARVDRLKGLGNAIVPQIAEWIGRRILEAEA